MDFSWDCWSFSEICWFSTGSLTKTLNRTQVIEESGLRPEYLTISCELQALAKIVRNELGNGSSENVGFPNTFGANSSPLFERGRFYDEYSARRNERLKRKKGETGDVGKTPYKLGVTVEPSKRRDTKKFESLRKSVPAALSVDRSENPRYLLRSSTKENKKPPMPFNVEKSAVAGDRKIGARRVRKVWKLRNGSHTICFWFLRSQKVFEGCLQLGFASLYSSVWDWFQWFYILWRKTYD